MAISAYAHAVNTVYTTYFTIKGKSAGHLFQGRYKSIVIEKERVYANAILGTTPFVKDLVKGVTIPGARGISLMRSAVTKATAGLQERMKNLRVVGEEMERIEADLSDVNG